MVLWERPHADPALRVSTEAIIGVEADRGWVVVRESIGSLDPTLTPPVENPRQAPGIVTELIKAIAFEDAMTRLSVAPHAAHEPGVRVIDAGNRTVMPGLIETHLHPLTLYQGGQFGQKGGIHARCYGTARAGFP